MDIQVDNISCGGCANAIMRGLGAIAGVTNVSVDIAAQRVSLTADEALRPTLVRKLGELGFPERVAGKAS